MTARRPLARQRRAAPALGVCLAAAFAALPEQASAHAPPLGARVLTTPDGAEEIIVTNRGLVFRELESGASQLLCNEALRISTAELPNVTLLADGGLLVASSSGLRLSRDRGCSWTDVGGMETTNTPALASAPGDPDTVFVASFTPERSGLLVTRDGGRSWETAFETDTSEYVHSLLVAGEGASHVYATLATYVANESPVHWLLRSLDGGQSWERRPLPLGDADYAARAATADPTDPGKLVLYTVANSPGLDDARLLASADAGDSFEVLLVRPEIRGADHDAEGRLWVAARDGLYRTPERDAAFERISAASELGCVSSVAGSVVVCGHYAGVENGPSGVGLSRDAGQSFEPLLDFAQVRAPIACDPSSLTATLCAQPWRDWEAEMLGTPGTNAPGPYGTPGMLPSEDVLATPPGGSSPAEGPGALEPESAAPGCSVSTAGSGATRSLLGALVVSCALWRRGRVARRSSARPSPTRD
jgi:hypothetical protein